MSNHARRRRHPRVSKDTIATAAAITSAARGCTCKPDISTIHTPIGPQAIVAHDDWCPAADTGMAFAIVPRRHASPEEIADIVQRATEIIDPEVER